MDPPFQTMISRTFVNGSLKIFIIYVTKIFSLCHAHYLHPLLSQGQCPEREGGEVENEGGQFMAENAGF